MRDRSIDPRLRLAAVVAGGVAIALTARYLMRRRRYFDPAGRTVLITGGSRGLGLVLARQLLHRGARVAICARDEAELARAKSQLSAISPEIHTIRCDLTQLQEIASMVDEISRTFGPIDVLINNAGIIQVGPAEHMTPEDYEQAMDIHFWAPYHLARSVIPQMRARGGGRIVNISSIGGKVPTPHLLPYVASKYALTGFSQALGTELARDNIYVTTVAPGLMRTGSPRNIDVKGQVRKEYAWFKVGDSLPGLSMDAERAAERIIDAFTHGDADLTLTLLARVGSRLHAMFPNLSAGLARAANWLLPAPGGHGDHGVKGWQAESAVSQSALTALTKRAARRNNEL